MTMRASGPSPRRGRCSGPTSVDDGGVPAAPAPGAQETPQTGLPVSRMPPPTTPGVDRSLWLPGTGTARLQLIDFVTPDATHAQLRLYFDGQVIPSVAFLPNPSRLTINIPEAALEGVPECRVEHPFTRGVSVAPGPSARSLEVTVLLGRLVTVPA